MKINLSNMESLYSSISGTSKTSAKKNTGDVQEISKNTTDISDVSLLHDQLEDIKSSAVQETEKGTDPDKLRALRTQIANGTYSVSGSDISSAMLKFSDGEKN